jgi:hypothetical protein
MASLLWLWFIATFPTSAEVVRDAIRSIDQGAILTRPTTSVDKPNVLAAKDSAETGGILKRYFSKIGTKGLPALQKDADTSLALQAAWELALAPGDEKGIPCPKRFLEFFEAHTGLKVPPRWENAVLKLGMEDIPDRDRLEKAIDKGPKRHEAETMEAQIERKNGKVVIHVGQQTVVVREAASSGVMLRWFRVGHWVAHIEPGRWFLTVANFNCNDHFDYMLCPLLCLDPRTAEILWRRQVWGMPFFIGPDGPRPPEVVLMPVRDQIVLLGICGRSAYAEAYTANNGQPVFRFSTDLWGAVNRMAEWSRLCRGLKR